MICAETCVGRIRYLGLVLYDADRVQEAASVPDERDLLQAPRDVFLDPERPEVQAAARRAGIPGDWIDAARRSPVYDLAMRWGVALPLHPEFRTLPMVWYVPPLSPVVSTLEVDGYEADPDDVFGAIENLRIPLEYLANLLTAGDVGAVRAVLQRLAAMRAYMRKREVLDEVDESLPVRVGLTGAELERMHDLGSPYAHVLDAIAAGLPPLSVTDRSEVERLAREGPPDEAVGLEPYGPPEAMPTGARP